jgi:hypothetical protein
MYFNYNNNASLYIQNLGTQNILLYLIAVPAYFVSVDKAGLSHEDYM